MSSTFSFVNCNFISFLFVWSVRMIFVLIPFYQLSITHICASVSAHLLLFSALLLLFISNSTCELRHKIMIFQFIVFPQTDYNDIDSLVSLFVLSCHNALNFFKFDQVSVIWKWFIKVSTKWKYLELLFLFVNGLIYSVFPFQTNHDQVRHWQHQGSVRTKSQPSDGVWQSYMQTR